MATHGSVSQPDVSQPDVSQPDVSQPDVSQPDVSQPDVSQPDVSQPDVSQPDVSQPDVSQPDVSQPDVSQPDVSQPDVSQPDVSQPDVSQPDAHLSPAVAAAYDDVHDDHFLPEVIQAAVDVLAELAGDGPVVELAVGTGRLAIPLAETGVTVHGIDISEPMLAELRKKPGASQVDAIVGDMTSTQACADARLVYLVYNTIMNLRTQQQQVACFRNAAAQLASGGRFLIETMVPELRLLPPGETIRPFDVSSRHLGFDEYVDLVNQISISHHYHIDGDRVRTNSPAFRYVWPSELDLMAQIAGLTLESRWANWQREPFTGDSRSHVSVWQNP